MTPPAPAPTSGLVLVWAAAAAGGLHALASLYWALGGRWLLATVGTWAVDLADARPVLAGLGLGLVALVKLVAAVVPVLVAYDRLPWSRLWRGVSWVGGLALVVYGGLNTLVAQLVLAGALGSADGYDPVSMTGHAWLWDPLFLLWGGALCLHLLATRRPVPSSGPAPAHPW